MKELHFKIQLAGEGEYKDYYIGKSDSFWYAAYQGHTSKVRLPFLTGISLDELFAKIDEAYNGAYVGQPRKR